MGDRNHDAENATNVSGGRQGWDLTAVALEDGSVAAGQETLAIQIASTDDAIVTAVVAAELAVDAPRFPTATPTLFPESVQGLAPATITLALTNDGALAADDVLLEMDLPEGIAVTAFAIDGQDGDAFGGSVVAEDFVDGVAIGTIEAGEDATITIELTSEIDGTFELAPTWTYEYVACVGDSPTTGRGSAEPVSLTVTRRDGGDDDDDGGGGCGCRTGGEPAAGGLLALGLLGLVRALTRRSA
jgi:MYXO-CTERM domain-containing protein